jgi:predicted molibdopterin-dependent oxidoreductase YjgC
MILQDLLERSRTILAGRRLSPDVESDTLSLTFDGQTMDARPSDTVASALIAAGVMRFGSTPGTDEPYRGFCLVGRCAECLVTVDGQPAIMACRTMVRPGLRVDTQTGLGAWQMDGSE